MAVDGSPSHDSLWPQKHSGVRLRGVYILQFWPDSLLFGNKVGRVFVQWEKGTSFKFMSEQFRGPVTTTYVVFKTDRRK